MGGWNKHEILLAGQNTSGNLLDETQLEVHNGIKEPTGEAILPPSDGSTINSTLKVLQGKELKTENFLDGHMRAEISDRSPVPAADRPTKGLNIPDDAPITSPLDVQNKTSHGNAVDSFPEDKATAESTKDSAKQLSKEECEYPEDGPKGGGSEHSIPQSALWMSELYYVIFPDDDKDENILTKHRWPKNTVDMIKGTCKAIKDKRNEIANDQTKTRMVHVHLQESFVQELQERNFIISEQDKSNVKQLFNFLKNCKLTKYEHQIKLILLQ